VFQQVLVPIRTAGDVVNFVTDFGDEEGMGSLSDNIKKMIQWQVNISQIESVQLIAAATEVKGSGDGDGGKKERESQGQRSGSRIKLEILINQNWSVANYILNTYYY
jgi:hypothetical protein